MKKFTESIQNEIEYEKIEDIDNELTIIKDFLSDKINQLKDINDNLSRYKSKSRKYNDQIDDSVFTLQILYNDLETSIENIEKIQNNLSSYKDVGRKKII